MSETCITIRATVPPGLESSPSIGRRARQIGQSARIACEFASSSWLRHSHGFSSAAEHEIEVIDSTADFVGASTHQGRRRRLTEDLRSHVSMPLVDGDKKLKILIEVMDCLTPKVAGR